MRIKTDKKTTLKKQLTSCLYWLTRAFDSNVLGGTNILHQSNVVCIKFPISIMAQTDLKFTMLNCNKIIPCVKSILCNIAHV